LLSSTLPRASPPPYERGTGRMLWLSWPSMTKYPTSNDDWTTTRTQSPSQPVIALRGTSSMTRRGCQPSLSQREIGSTNKRIGSSNWPKGKWQGSPGSMFRGKPHLLQKCTLPQPWGRKTSWGPFTPCRNGYGRYSQDLLPTMVRYSSISKSLTTGEWLERSSDSDNLSIIYRTSTSESPITRLSSEEYCRPRLHQKGAWSSPILTIMPRTFKSSALSPGDQAALTSEPSDSGEGRTPSK
jgi:hypothetical protein